jgi:hypothetical protein
MPPWRGSGRLIILGGTLLLVSWLLLLLQAIRLLSPSLPHALIAYVGSLAGLVIGMFGALQHAHQGRSR